MKIRDRIKELRRAQLHYGDVLDVLPTLPEESFDAVFCDPPYELSTGKGRGFMGKQWDGTGVAFQPDTWREVLRVVKPGGHLLAFGGTRTVHRMVCAIEDAGWEIRVCVMWLYGSGFPKSLNISKAIDKVAGAEREVVGVSVDSANRTAGTYSHENGSGYNKGNEGERIITAPATAAARQWDGWGTALKPAWEPIVLAMKPLDGTFAENAVKHGVAGINVDGCRVCVADDDPHHRNLDSKSRMKSPNQVYGDYGLNYHTCEKSQLSQKGRWPANVILSHHPECVQAGTKKVKTGTHIGHNRNGDEKPGGYDGGWQKDTTDQGHANTDGLETVEDWRCHPDCPVGMFPETKSGKAVVGTGSGPQADQTVYSGPAGGVVKSCFGDSGSAARFFYCAKASKAERGEGNNHPTVKPLSLCEYLARLLLPPERDTPRRLLVPFAGSGSEILGALEAGWDEAVGIEREVEYCDIAERRINQRQPTLFDGAVPLGTPCDVG